MSAPPMAPRLLKGALVAFRLPTPVPEVLPFQYNPETLSRTLEAQRAGEGGDELDALRLTGAPVETIKVDVELDATDLLEESRPEATRSGLLGPLAALETLLYPHSTSVARQTRLLAAGTLEVIPTQGPFVLFVWGPKRILPVRITEFSVTEEAHDPALNPIRAKVALGLRVLSYSDLPVTHPGHQLFFAHQVMKEGLAVASRVSSLDAVLGGDRALF